jgi:hypothetical protein
MILNERSLGDHTQSINIFLWLDPRPSHFYRNEGPMLVYPSQSSLETRSLEKLSTHLHAGYAVPRYRKVSTPARWSTFCDSHMQTLASPFLIRNVLGSSVTNGSIDRSLSHKLFFVGAFGRSSVRSDWRSIERVPYLFQHSACKYVNQSAPPYPI